MFEDLILLVERAEEDIAMDNIEGALNTLSILKEDIERLIEESLND
jgi:hypothetical protein